ncbi:MAG: glycosyltransferase [Verrucomicrobia bacterium]|nr:glycosyltransferase [Verrucomicrobiota bacterium]
MDPIPQPAPCLRRPKVSVVIPAFNEERLLPATLGAIREASRGFGDRGWTHEWIVCDNNSTDRTAEIAAAAGARVVFEPVNQIGRARNAGARAATGEWILFIDADSRPTRELFADAVATASRPGVIAIGSTIRLDGGGLSAAVAAEGWNLVSRLARLLAGSFIMVERQAFETVGGFSLEFYAGEELDLVRRLKAQGKQDHRRIVILHRNPLETSARKVRLYGPMETFGFLLRAVFRPRSTLRNRDSCFLWYDARR